MGEIFSKYGTPYLVGYPSRELNWVFDGCEDNLCLCGVQNMDLQNVNSANVSSSHGKVPFSYLPLL